jgi:hypothetical protein
LFFQSAINVQRDYRTSSEPPSERELMIKQYYSQKILDLETKLHLANGKSIAFYNEVFQSYFLIHFIYFYKIS